MSYTVTLWCGCQVYVSCHPVTRLAHSRIVERRGPACPIRRHEARATRDGHKGARAGAGQKLHGAVLHSGFDFDVCLKQATPGTARGPVDIDG